MVPKQPHRVNGRYKDDKPITHMPLHFPADECQNIQGECQYMGTFCDGTLQGRPQPRLSCVNQDYLLYIIFVVGMLLGIRPPPTAPSRYFVVVSQ